MVKKVLTNFLKAVIIINIKLIELYEFFKTNEVCVSGREVRRQQTVNLPSESPSQVRVLSGTIRYCNIRILFGSIEKQVYFIALSRLSFEFEPRWNYIVQSGKTVTSFYDFEK